MERVTTDCSDPDETLADTKACLCDITRIISKFIGVEVQKSTEKYQLFNISHWLN